MAVYFPIFYINMIFILLYYQDDERAHFFQGNVSNQMSIILNKFLTKKYEDITSINFEELCTWSLWPSYFCLWRGKHAAYSVSTCDKCTVSLCMCMIVYVYPIMTCPMWCFVIIPSFTSIACTLREEFPSRQKWLYKYIIKNIISIAQLWGS